MSDLIVFDEVSKFYDEVLGLNRVNLELESGVTSLVGPNGSGKSTLMNLTAGLLIPSHGEVSVLGISTRDPERLFKHVGYCTQYDSFPRRMTGMELIETFLELHGFDRARARARAWEMLEMVNLTEAASRKIAGYSKGMRQRVKLAQAMAHEPEVLILDEPLNGLDPMARAEVIELFKKLAHDGRHVIVSSHILHEIDLLSDKVVLINGGYVIAEGSIRGVRSELSKHPMQIMVRCDAPAKLAAAVFDLPDIVEARRIDDEGLLIRTRDADSFFAALNRLVLDNELKVETMSPADEDVHAVYDYLIGSREVVS